MKKVSIQDLKARLSAVVAEAEAGETVIVTRHSTPVAMVGPAKPATVHRGARAGAGPLRAAVKRGSKGRYLPVLLADRADR
jgi:prevent-host-death family protein